MVYAKGREPCFAQGRSSSGSSVQSSAEAGILEQCSATALRRHLTWSGSTDVAHRRAGPDVETTLQPSRRWCRVRRAIVRSEESSHTVVFGCRDHKARFLSLLSLNTLENSHTNLARVAVTAHFKLSWARRGTGQACMIRPLQPFSAR